MRAIFLTMTILFTGILIPIPQARAMDPVSIGILAPIAVKSMPRVVNGMKSAGGELFLAGKETLMIFLLPVGIVQSTILAPFGQFKGGITNIIRGGAIAPFKMVFHVVMTPVKFVTGFF